MGVALLFQPGDEPQWLLGWVVAEAGPEMGLVSIKLSSARRLLPKLAALLASKEERSVGHIYIISLEYP